MDGENIADRNNVQVLGEGSKTVLLAHGFGCDQKMWRAVVPGLATDYRLVLFDYMGWGGSRRSAFDVERYSSLDGYARDIIEIVEALDLRDVTIVGHSVSAMTGLLASLACPERFERHVMVCPSPCFLNKPPDYQGGFEPEDLDQLLDLMDKNFGGWAHYLAPLVLGESAGPDLIRELEKSFCSTDPSIAKAFARATFLSDLRDRLPLARHPSLLLQSRDDSLASVEVGRYMQQHMPDSELEIVEADGHCLHMTRPDTVVAAIIRATGGTPKRNDHRVDMTDEPGAWIDMGARSALDTFPVGCLVSGPDRKIKYANAYLRELVGRSDDELLGMPLSALMTGGSVLLLNTYLVPVLTERGRVSENLLQFRHSGGDPVSVIANAWIVEATGDTHWSFVSVVESLG